MKKTPIGKMLLFFSTLSLGFFSLTPLVFAVQIAGQPNYDSLSNTSSPGGSGWWQTIGNGHEGHVGSVTIAVADLPAGSYSVSIYYFSQPDYSDFSAGHRCDVGFSSGFVGTTTGFLTFDSAVPASGGACDITTNKYYALFLYNGSGMFPSKVFGNQYLYNDYRMSDNVHGLPVTGDPDSSVKSMFYEIDTSSTANPGAVLSPIGGFPTVGVATSSVATYCNQNLSTSTTILGELASGVSEAMCNAGSFLFVPAASALSSFASLGSTTQQKIPFSYFYDIKNNFASLSASTSSSVPEYSADLANAPLSGTSTPIGNFLPSLTLLSTSTINQYLPSGAYDLLMLVASSAIWAGVGVSIYYRVHKVFSHT